MLPKVSIPLSSRFANMLASAGLMSSRVLTAGMVFALGAAGGADWEGGGGDIEDGPCEKVPCRLNETGLAICVGKDGVDIAREGANGLFDLHHHTVSKSRCGAGISAYPKPVA